MLAVDWASFESDQLPVRILLLAEGRDERKWSKRQYLSDHEPIPVGAVSFYWRTGRLSEDQKIKTQVLRTGWQLRASPFSA